MRSYIANVINFRFLNFWRLNTFSMHRLERSTTSSPGAARWWAAGAERHQRDAVAAQPRTVVSARARGELNWNGAAWLVPIDQSIHHGGSGPNFELSVGPSYSRGRNVSQFVRKLPIRRPTATFGTRSVFAT